MPANTEMHSRGGGTAAFDDDPATWSAEAVKEWLKSIDMEQYAACFAKNKIRGKVLALLTEEHLKEAGVVAIGDRVLLHQKCHEIRRAMVHKMRNEVLWESDEHIYTHGCGDWVFKQCTCYPCRIDPDHYKLTGSALYVSEVDNSKAKGCNCQISKRTRTIELAAITGTSDYFTHSVCDCGCAADVVNVRAGAPAPRPTPRTLARAHAGRTQGRARPPPGSPAARAQGRGAADLRAHRDGGRAQPRRAGPGVHEPLGSVDSSAS